MAGYNDLANWRHRRKRELIEYKGGKCKICGYDKIENLSAFSFHHIDPTQKEFTISSTKKNRSLEEQKKEADKCDLLCVLCHAEIHELQYREKRIKREQLQIQWLKPQKCLFCCEIFQPKRREQKFCCPVCFKKYRNKDKIRPSAIELEQLIKEMSWEAIGRKYGVTGNAVKKWAKRQKIPFVTKSRIDKVP